MCWSKDKKKTHVSTGCSTRYQTRHFFNNFTDITIHFPTILCELTVYTNTHEQQPYCVGTLSQMTARSAERRVRQETGWLAGGPLPPVPTIRRTTDTHYRHTLQTQTAGTHYRHTLQTHTTDTHHRHTLQTHTSDTHYRHTLQAHTAGTHYRHTLQTHTADTHYRHTLQTHTTDTHCRHTLQAHTAGTHYRHTLQTHTTDTPQTHSSSFLTQRTCSCSNLLYHVYQDTLLRTACVLTNAQSLHNFHDRNWRTVTDWREWHWPCKCRLRDGQIIRC
jgi:hypothetical protein